MAKQRLIDPYELDEYEQSIEDDMESYVRLSPEEEKKEIANLVEVAKSHVAARTQIDLDLPTRDLEAIRYRASKLGIPYKTFINMILHKYAISPPEKIFV